MFWGEYLGANTLICIITISSMLRRATGKADRMKTVIVLLCASILSCSLNAAQTRPAAGTASWYGEAHRGKPMANGQPFNPDQLTAASWFYPLGTQVRVTAYARSGGSVKPVRSVVVRITDRGPAKHLVRDGRIIDLGHAAFKKLASPQKGLVQVKVRPERKRSA